MIMWLPFLEIDEKIPDDFDEEKEIGFFEYELRKESEENESLLST